MHINFKSQCFIIIVLQISFVHLPVQVTRTKELHRYTGIKEPSTFIGTINCFYVQNFVFHIHLPLCKPIVVKATPLGSQMSTDQSNLIQSASLSYQTLSIMEQQPPLPLHYPIKMFMPFKRAALLCNNFFATISIGF